MGLKIIPSSVGRLGGGGLSVMDGGAAAPATPWYLLKGIDPTSCLAVYKAQGAADLASSYINLITPGTFDLTADSGKAPSFNTATGWGWSGAQFLHTGIIPANGDYTIIVYGTTNGAAGVSFGCYQTTGDKRFFLIPGGGSSGIYYDNGVDLSLPAASGILDGVQCFAGKNAYKNGDAAGTIGAGGSVPTIEAYIGALNNNGTANTFLTGTTRAVLVYKAVLTDVQVFAVCKSMLSGFTTWSPVVTKINLQRYAGNPILTLGASGSWEDTDIAVPDVLWDTPNNRWLMNYSGFDGTQWHTGLAYSTDLLNWTKDPLNPVLSPNEDEGYIAADQAMCYKDGVYYLVYDGAPTSAFDVRLATSTDLHNWTRHGVIIPFGAAGTFDSLSAADPQIRVQPDGTFAIFYVGANTAGGSRKIGWATSTDGLTWTKRGILLDPSAVSGGQNGTPNQMPDTALNYIMFMDNTSASPERAADEWITVDGGATFVNRSKVLEKTGSTWEKANIFDATPIRVGDKIYVYYTGAPVTGLLEGMGAQIGLAIGDY